MDLVLDGKRVSTTPGGSTVTSTVARETLPLEDGIFQVQG